MGALLAPSRADKRLGIGLNMVTGNIHTLSWCCASEPTIDSTSSVGFECGRCGQVCKLPDPSEFWSAQADMVWISTKDPSMCKAQAGQLELWVKYWTGLEVEVKISW